MSTSELDTSLTTSLFHARSDSVQVDPSAVPVLVAQQVSAQYFTAAVITLMIYHKVLTMEKEVKYFWCAPRNTVSLIYLANRYIGVLGAVSIVVFESFIGSLTSCRVFFWIRSICDLLNVVLIDYKKLAIFFNVILGLEAAVGLGIIIYVGLFEEFVVVNRAEGMQICAALRSPPKFQGIMFWGLPLALGTILLCLALYKAVEYWRLSPGFKVFHLVRVLIEDQILYHGFVVFTSVTAITSGAVIITNTLTANLLAAASSPTLLCIIGGQLLINLKEANERGANGGTSYRFRNMSNIQFA